MAKVTKTLSRGHQRLNQSPEDRLPLGMNKVPMWDNLTESKDSILGGCHAMFTQIAAALNFIKEDPTAYSFVKDKNRFISLITSAQSDFDANVIEINKIYEQHKNRKGYSRDPDDHMLCIHLHGMYTEQFAKFTGSVHPTINELSEMITAAAEANENYLKEQAAQKTIEAVQQ